MSTDSAPRKRINLRKLVRPGLFVLGGAALFALGMRGAVSFVSRPEFCGSCHEMRPAAEEWLISSHYRINCIDCHTEPGIAAAVKVVRFGSQNALKHVTGAYQVPIETDVDDSSCERCHDKSQRPELIPQASLKIAHSKHKSEKCADCHGRLVHTGLVAGKPLGVTPAHVSNNCLTCHKPENCPHGDARVSCESCHTGIIPNHNLAEKRGVMPRQSCAACHEQKGLGSGEECRTCHVSPHGVNANCNQCHTPDMNSWAVRSFKHPVNLLGRHAELSCNQCHKGQRLTGLNYVCGDCHKPPANHFGAQCETCHQAGSAWKR
ncbi:MAG: NapC/NirT family cytochrome c [Chloroflexi bacterium]|nr:NapC/NirT family cytochrome c [Chloroflexota bacterium]